MALGSPFLTSYDDRMLERAFAETAPGQADIVDLDSLHTCSECAHWRAGRGKGKTGYCRLFMKFARLSAPGPKLRAQQRACRRWQSNLPVASGMGAEAGPSSPAHGIGHPPHGNQVD